MLEIYLEDIKDLLCKRKAAAEPKKHQVTHSQVRSTLSSLDGRSQNYLSWMGVFTLSEVGIPHVF